jgi:polyhydroxybutyrate depolymerase
MIMIRFALFAAAACMLAVTGCADAQRWERPSRERNAAAESSLPLQAIRHDGRERSFLIARPNRTAPPGGYAVVIGLHGGGRGDAESAATAQGFHRMNAGEPVLVVYPNGIGAEWNDGRGQTFTRDGDLTADDVGFLSALIDHLIAYEGANPDRVYLTGASNGAMMTHRAGCELSHKLAAIAPVIAPMPANIAPVCDPARPLPVLMILGEDDPWVPFDGGEVTPLGRASGQVISADQTMAVWADANRCAPRPRVSHDSRRPARDGTRIRRETYPRCAAETVLIAIEGGGHTWPGSGRGAGRAAQRLVGVNTSQLDATQEIWEFFSSKRR